MFFKKPKTIKRFDKKSVLDFIDAEERDGSSLHSGAVTVYFCMGLLAKCHLASDRIVTLFKTISAETDPVSHVLRMLESTSTNDDTDILSEVFLLMDCFINLRGEINNEKVHGRSFTVSYPLSDDNKLPSLFEQNFDSLFQTPAPIGNAKFAGVDFNDASSFRCTVPPFVVCLLTDFGLNQELISTQANNDTQTDQAVVANTVKQIRFLMSTQPIVNHRPAVIGNLDQFEKSFVAPATDVTKGVTSPMHFFVYSKKKSSNATLSQRRLFDSVQYKIPADDMQNITNVSHGVEADVCSISHALKLFKTLTGLSYKDHCKDASGLLHWPEGSDEFTPNDVGLALEHHAIVARIIFDTFRVVSSFKATSANDLSKFLPGILQQAWESIMPQSLILKGYKICGFQNVFGLLRLVIHSLTPLRIATSGGRHRVTVLLGLLSGFRSNMRPGTNHPYYSRDQDWYDDNCLPRNEMIRCYTSTGLVEQIILRNPKDFVIPSGKNNALELCMEKSREEGQIENLDENMKRVTIFGEM